MRVSIRWWLSAACAVVAAVTATAGAVFAGERSEQAFRDRAQDLAAGVAFSAAVELARRQPAARADAVEMVARPRRLSLWLYDADGRLVSAPTSGGVAMSLVPERRAAVAAASARRRFISTNRELRATTVGVPLADGALVAYAPHPDVQETVGVVRGQLARAAAVAVIAGGLVGFAFATLTARRLRRIRDTAAAIEAGEFDARAAPMFGDEIGDVGRAIDAMRIRLKHSFENVKVGRERLRRLLERLHEGVVAVDGDYRIEFANRRARQLLVDDLVAGDELPDIWQRLPLRQFATSVAEQEGAVVERRFELSEDRTFLLVGVAPRHAGEGVLLVIADVSERERRERAEREFVTNAAHELRTPVAAIVGAVDVLQSGGKNIPQEREVFLSHIETASKRLARLAQTLLILARVQTRQEEVELEELRVRPLLEEVARHMTPHAGVTVEIECADDAVVLAEPNLIHHALLNLAQNASAHTSRGRIVLACDLTARDAVIEVRDTGRGIAPEAQQHVFERFYRSTDNGSEGFGLGLAIVRQAVRAQRGEIELQSLPGVGTTARLKLRHAQEAE